MTLVQKMRFLYSCSLWNNHSDPFFFNCIQHSKWQLLLNLKSWQMQVVGKTWSCCNIKCHGFKFSIILFNRHQRQLFRQSTFTIIIPVLVCKCISTSPTYNHYLLSQTPENAPTYYHCQSVFDFSDTKNSCSLNTLILWL